MVDVPALPEGADSTSRLRSVLTGILAVAFVLALATSAFVALSPPETGTPYTEMYLLNGQGAAADYPTNLSVREVGTVTVGVKNAEQETVEYELVVRARNETLGRTSQTLGDGGYWRQPFTYTFDEPGPARIRFLLYRGDDTFPDSEPYRELRLIVNVREAGV